MNATDLCYTPATRLAAMIRAKEISPVELTRTVLERIERLNPKVNAFCVVLKDQALATAREAEAAVMKGGALPPLLGIPFSIKDLAMTKGVRTTGGSHIYADRVPDHDAPFVRRLKAAGGVFLGKTTSPEFGWKGLSDSPLLGATRNPWNTAMTTGGSSAGAGAAAAAGLGPLCHGSDGAGSIRIPSAFCGVFGHKPSYGRVPQWPVSNNDYTTHNGPMTRTVADAALMLSVMAGPDDWDKTALDAPPADYVGLLDRGREGAAHRVEPRLRRLRVDPEVAEVVRGAARRLQEAGAKVERGQVRLRRQPRDDPRDLGGARGGHLRRAPAQVARQDGSGPGRLHRGRLRCTMEQYIQMRERKLAYWDSVRPLFEKYDLLLSPSLSVAAFPVNRLNPEHWPQHVWDWIPWASFSYPFNFTGQPASSVPCGFTPAGLPVGLQIVGRAARRSHRAAGLGRLREGAPVGGQRPAVD